MQNVGILFCCFRLLQYLCGKKFPKRGIIIEDFRPQLVRTRGFFVHKMLNFSIVKQLGVDWI